MSINILCTSVCSADEWSPFDQWLPCSDGNSSTGSFIKTFNRNVGFEITNQSFIAKVKLFLRAYAAPRPPPPPPPPNITCRIEISPISSGWRKLAEIALATYGVNPGSSNEVKREQLHPPSHT